LLTLTFADVDQENQVLRVNDGKGGRDRVVPLSRIACAFLESYVNAVRPQLLRGPTHRTLLISLEAARCGAARLTRS
jgi:integrase/recombinase XerD